MKIKYYINLLLDVKTADDESLIKTLEDCSETTLQVFSSTPVIDLIDFKWENYAKYSHYLGFAMHVFYILLLTVFIYNTYLIGLYGEETHGIYSVLLILGIVYPFLYDLVQLCR